MELNPQERLDLRKMVRESDCGDNTEEIRRLKHSQFILKDVSVIEKLKRSHREMRACSFAEFTELCMSECSFLYNHYTDLFHKLLKDELNLGILVKMIKVLHMIEEGQVDQHEGSVLVGKILKEMYVDSAVRRGENLDREREENGEVRVLVESKNISWKEYKKGFTK